MYRQGDILLVKCGSFDGLSEDIPRDAQVINDGVIARGEVTGHTHAIRHGSRAALMIAAGIAYVRALEACHLDHQEHGNGNDILPAGDWVVRRQREYIPDGWRQVED